MKVKMKITLSRYERAILRHIKGEARESDFVGFLIRNYAESVEGNTMQSPYMDFIHSSGEFNEKDQGMVTSITSTISRLYGKILDEKILENGGQSLTESVGEILLDDKAYQIQLRLQSNKSAWIHPYKHEIGVNNINISSDLIE